MRTRSRQKLNEQTSLRDRALDLFDVHRADLLDIAREVAVELAEKNGRVSGPEVIEELRSRGMGEALDRVDRRFMGGVFRSGKGWTRIAWENIGSHRQPVSVWKRTDDSKAAG